MFPIPRSYAKRFHTIRKSQRSEPAATAILASQLSAALHAIRTADIQLDGRPTAKPARSHQSCDLPEIGGGRIRDMKLSPSNKAYIQVLGYATETVAKFPFRNYLYRDGAVFPLDLTSSSLRPDAGFQVSMPSIRL